MILATTPWYTAGAFTMPGSSTIKNLTTTLPSETLIHTKLAIGIPVWTDILVKNDRQNASKSGIDANDILIVVLTTIEDDKLKITGGSVGVGVVVGCISSYLVRNSV